MSLSAFIRWCGLLFISLCAFLSMHTGLVAKIGAAEKTVRGIGYPPIKTVTRSQALLMARRAAILDAYGKIVRRTGEIKEESFFIHLSGFIRGMKITGEELLPDGGIRVTMSIEHGTPSPASSSQNKVNTDKQVLQPQPAAPKQISREQWFQVISSMVAFETNDHPEKNTK